MTKNAIRIRFEVDSGSLSLVLGYVVNRVLTEVEVGRSTRHKYRDKVVDAVLWGEMYLMYLVNSVCACRRE